MVVEEKARRKEQRPQAVDCSAQNLKLSSERMESAEWTLSPAESGVEDLHQQLVAGRHQLVVLNISGRTVHHAVVFRQQSLDDSERESSVTHRVEI